MGKSAKSAMRGSKQTIGVGISNVLRHAEVSGQLKMNGKLCWDVLNVSLPAEMLPRRQTSSDKLTGVTEYWLHL